MDDRDRFENDYGRKVIRGSNPLASAGQNDKWFLGVHRRALGMSRQAFRLSIRGFQHSQPGTTRNLDSGSFSC